MRTLVVSDLHLGSRLGRDVLRHPEALALLLQALDGVDRLVLLGDTVELAERRSRQALQVAQPVLRAIGDQLGPEGQVVVVPGNHDAALVRPWLRTHGVPDDLDALIPADATPLLARFVAMLAPARVEVRSPGVWLSPRVWATHGHYLDRHLLPESAYGIFRGLIGRAPDDPARPADYESYRRPSVTGVETLLTQWLPRPLAGLVEDLAEGIRAATMPSLPRRLQSHRLAPLSHRVLGLQMQRASIPAVARVAHRLGVDADWVLFGHVHRLGPRPDDDASLWAGPAGRPRIANSGCWIYEPLLLHRGDPPHPYWPGGALLLDGDGDPEAISLLDDLDVEALHHRRPRPPAPTSGTRSSGL